jgi:ABC-2 type transport system ATP-binding protein
MLQARLLGLTRQAARARGAELLEAFGLTTSAGRAVKTYSGGMQRRLDIARSIVAAPALLFLDEPTTGLDPQSRSQVWETVRLLVRHGTTVLLTTQYLDEADQLSDRIAVMDHGKIIANGTPSQLKASVGSGVLRVGLATPAERCRAQHILAQALGVMVRADPGSVTLTARIEGGAADQGTTEAVARAMNQLARHEVKVTTFALGQPSLDEVFLALTGHAVQENRNEGEVA